MGDWPHPDVRPLPEPKRSFHELNLGTSTVPVSGPTQAVLLARLWDLMLCSNDPRRHERASRRSESWTPPYCTPTDKVASDLLDRTLMHVRSDLIPRLWAPVTDPVTGSLIPHLNKTLNDVTRRRHIRIPSSAVEIWEMKMNPSRMNFRSMRSRGHPPVDVGCLPGLRIEYDDKKMLVVRDPQGRIHCPHGPAIVHEDGTPEFYWRDTRVPSYFIPITDHWRAQYPDCDLQPLNREYKVLSPTEALSVTNTEVRRAACEIVGWNNILEGLHAVTIDKDSDPQIGELLRVRIPSDWTEIEQQFLRVQCGTGRTFALAVPMTCRTALEANAWTYGLTAEEYKPEIRT